MNQSILSPSRIALQAFSLDIAGSQPANDDAIAHGCSMCGGPILEGEKIDLMILPKTFTSGASLASPGGKWRCGACCRVLEEKLFQMNYGSGLFSAQGFRPALRRVHRAWLLQNMPKPPFILAIQTGKSQHTVWRSPVTISTDMLMVRVGDQVMRARMAVLRKTADEVRSVVWPAVQAMEQAALDSAVATHNTRKMAKPINIHSTPFNCDSLRFQRVGGGMLKFPVIQALESGFLKREDAPAIFQLNAAEAWLMDAMLNPDAEEPPLITDFTPKQ